MSMVALGDVAEINPRLPEKPRSDEVVSFLPMAGLGTDGKTDVGEERPFGEVSKGYTPFLDGDLLVAKITPCFQNNKIGHARIGRRVGVGSTEFHVIRPRSDVADARYLLHFLRRDQVRIAGERRMTGSGGQRRVPAGFLQGLELLLPPLDEQRRIAALLDKIERLALMRARVGRLLTELPSVMMTALTDELSRVPTCALSELADIGSGITKGRRIGDVATRQVPYLAVANVQDGRLSLDAVKTIAATDREVDRFALRPGDLVLTEGGDPDKLGRGTIWRGERPLMLHQNHIFRVRISAGSPVRPEYLSAFLAGQEARRYFLRGAKQTTGIASINKTQLGATPVRLPPLAVQERFVEQLAASRAALHRSSEQAATLDAMRASLQARAFSGKR